ncbi:MarR family winged helix-turn-helix transcriptional regulator [Nocardia bovistercoris]|uniref:MarR family transcriptional regulator n=1 Tax=Nocardia bovistercoris TaxID=2785916 RepID=A0A931IB05_9NOCA|nr:MarR family transcriptional regulator [Nocardia bovistercoris]MBH0776575.1 MarR family transcriptional regulator [Nocardia bovistercoris]
MDKAVDSIEFETMLFGRYSLATRKRTERVLDRSVYILLSRLHMEGPMTIAQLGEALGLDDSTVNRQTAATVRSGLLKRIPDPHGGMARKFRVTAEGERQLESQRAQNVGHLDGILTEWDPEDVAVFAAYLARFNTDIERYHGRPWPRPAESQAAARIGRAESR